VLPAPRSTGIVDGTEIWARFDEDLDPASLADKWRHTVASFEAYGHRYETARSQARLGAVLQACGDPGASQILQTALATARELGAEHVRTIDSQSASAAIAMLGLAIQRRLEPGTTDEQVDALVERYRREAGLLFTVDTLEYLARGGRIGRARAWAGELLNIKPILSITDGEVLPVKRVRGNRKAFLEFASAFESSTVDRPSLRVGIAHAESSEKAEALRELVRDRRPAAEIEVVTTLGPVVGAHAGPGTVGFFWYDDAV